MQEQILRKQRHASVIMAEVTGMDVRANSPVEAIDSEGVVIAGNHLLARTVIWTAGVAVSFMVGVDPGEHYAREQRML